jgi:hypothetical protein
VSLIEPVFVALNGSGARYVVVGGVATVLHGFARLTADVDVVDLAPEAARRAITALTALGLRPRAPVAAELFADAAVRRSWIEGKGMRVFSLWDPRSPMREVDLLVEHPLEFEGLFARSVVVPVGTTDVRIASIDDLLALKRMAGRPEDALDIEALERIRDAKERRGG